MIEDRELGDCDIGGLIEGFEDLLNSYDPQSIPQYDNPSIPRSLNQSRNLAIRQFPILIPQSSFLNAVPKRRELRRFDRIGAMSVASGRQGAVAFFVTFCVLLVVLAIALNVQWIVSTWRQVVPLVLGILVFAALITGLILYTIFLVREIRRNEQKDAFINAVTHELKTPVTSIRLHLETLKTRAGTIPEETRREFYSVMLDDTDRLMQTIEQVLRAGEAGKTTLHRERVNLAALTDECIALTRTRRHLTEAQLHRAPFAGDDRPAEVLGDASALRVAIVNLLDNAVKYSSETIDVSVEAGVVGDWGIVRVTDRGAGFAPGEAKRLFKRFYRIPGALTQRIKGTGLGLYIVHHTADQHGGRASASSPGPGLGATFTLEIPAAPPAPLAEASS
jgi:signal transduction histidine kinase